MGVLVLGKGIVGQAVAHGLTEPGPVAVLTRSTHPALATPGEGARAVIEAAAQAIGATAVVNAVGLLRGTDAELEDANDRWVRWLVTEGLAGLDARLVHIGSAAEYGDPGAAEPIAEHHPSAPTSTYGRTKWAGTQSVLEARENGLDAVVVRGFNLVGPELAPGSPLHQFVTDVDALSPDGGIVTVRAADTIRDFVTGGDLASAVWALAALPSLPPVVNVCSGVGLRFDDIVVAIATARGKAAEVRSLDEPGITAVVGDPTLLGHLIGWHPAMSLDRLTAACPPPALSNEPPVGDP